MHAYEVRPRKDHRGVDLISVRKSVRLTVVIFLGFIVPAPTPTGFAEIVSDDFPVLHAMIAIFLLLQNCTECSITFTFVGISYDSPRVNYDEVALT